MIDSSVHFIDEKNLPSILIENKNDLLPKEEENFKLEDYAKEKGYNGVFKVSVNENKNIMKSIDFLFNRIYERLEDYAFDDKDKAEEKKKVEIVTKEREDGRIEPIVHTLNNNIEKKTIKDDIQIVLIGDSNTGKSSYVKKWLSDVYLDKHEPTKETEFYFVDYETKNGLYQIDIWDTPGINELTNCSKKLTQQMALY